MNPAREIAYRVDPALWMREVLGIEPHAWQEEFLRTERGASIVVLTARQVGKTTAAACGMAHSALFMPGSSKSATNSLCRSAEVTIGNCIRSAMKWHGGRASTSTPCQLPRGFGRNATQCLHSKIANPNDKLRRFDRSHLTS